jgi:hypothetical protein
MRWLFALGLLLGVYHRYSDRDELVDRIEQFRVGTVTVTGTTDAPRLRCQSGQRFSLARTRADVRELQLRYPLVVPFTDIDEDRRVINLTFEIDQNGVQ